VKIEANDKCSTLIEDLLIVGWRLTFYKIKEFTKNMYEP